MFKLNFKNKILKINHMVSMFLMTSSPVTFNTFKFKGPSSHFNLIKFPGFTLHYVVVCM